MNTQDSNDPFETAGNIQEPTRLFFGQNFFDMYHCILEKGGANRGKPAFDPNVHDPKQKRTAISINIAPLPDSKMIYGIDRELVAEIRDGDWSKIILPSIKALGLMPRDLVGKYVKVELVPTGSYVNSKGETKQLTMPKYMEVYPDQETCQAANDALFNNHTEQPSLESLVEEAFPATAPTNGNGMSREVAYKFLQTFVVQTGKDPQKLAEKLEGNPMVKAHFTINSPEVTELLTA